jgi:hypothetical protein
MISIPNVSFIERHAMPLEQLTNLFLKREFSMMFGLVGDVEDNSLSIGLAYRECAVAVLPCETLNTLLL